MHDLNLSTSGNYKDKIEKQNHHVNIHKSEIAKHDPDNNIKNYSDAKLNINRTYENQSKNQISNKFIDYSHL